MTFRRSITRLSELVADTVTGAVVSTADSGNRVAIFQSGTFGIIQLLSGLATETGAAAMFLDNATRTLRILSGKHSDLPAQATITLTPTAGPLGSLILAGAARVSGSLQVGPAGVAAAAAMDFGAVSATTDANGQVVVNHNLGVTPTAILLASGLRNQAVNYLSAGPASFSVRTVAADTNTLVATANTAFSWLALA